MSDEEKSIVLIPKYMKDFKCIGSACEDTCCAGWKVAIDRDTHNKYKNCRNNELKNKLQDNIKRNRKDSSDKNYSSIKMNDEGLCPFLTDTKLCRIQAELGEKYLSYTCHTYPRDIKKVNGIVQIAAMVSCPEAARIILLNPEMMEFEQVEESSLKYNSSASINTNAAAYKQSAVKYFEELRAFTIQVLQCRDYKLWERLVMLGIFYQTVQEYVDDKIVDEIPELIVEYIGGIEKGVFDQTLKEVPNNPMIQMELLNSIINKRVKMGFHSQRYVDNFNKFVKGIRPDKELRDEALIANYLNAYEQYYIPIMEKHDYILENYLVNHVFKNLFPFSLNSNIFGNYVMLIVHYALIKMQLIGVAGYYKEDFDINHVIDLIYSFAKSIEHSKEFIEIIMDFLKEAGYGTLSHMLLLIKN
jgi:lysine-N-methylase